MQCLKTFLQSGWGKLLLSNVPLLFSLNAARLADAAAKGSAVGFFWWCVMLVNGMLWVALTWEMVFPALPRKT